MNSLDLYTSWLRAWRGVGASGDGAAVFNTLVARYGEPHRRYHTLQHLAECLAAFDQARHLAAHPEIVRDRRILDFGAGSGLLAIAAAKAGATAVAATDIDPLAQAAIALNAEANCVAVTLLTGDLTAPDAALPNVEVVLAGDVFYLPQVARRTMPFLIRCAAAGMTVLIGDPYRAPLPRGKLRLIAEYPVADMGRAIGAGPATGAVFSLPPPET